MPTIFLSFKITFRILATRAYFFCLAFELIKRALHLIFANKCATFFSSFILVCFTKNSTTIYALYYDHHTNCTVLKIFCVISFVHIEYKLFFSLVNVDCDLPHSKDESIIPWSNIKILFFLSFAK